MTYHCCFFWPGVVSFSKAAYETSRLKRAEIPTYRIPTITKRAMAPMKMPVQQSQSVSSSSIARYKLTWTEKLVFIKERLVAVFTFLSSKLSKVAFQVLVKVFLVFDIIGVVGYRGALSFFRLPRRGGVHDRVFGRWDSINNFRQEEIYTINISVICARCRKAQTYRCEKAAAHADPAKAEPETTHESLLAPPQSP